ncbi:MAG: ribbon-helix-helix domain-containing protein [Desulfobacterales bacterium]|nr:ribbon-helix-helix domain-containing protein [Desulfobacterales bacterium]
MKKTLSVKLDANLYNQLELIAIRKGVSKSFLVRKKLESLLSESGEMDDLTLLNSITKALQKNQSFPFKVNWHRIERELAESTPEWPSADEAMKHSRKR